MAHPIFSQPRHLNLLSMTDADEYWRLHDEFRADSTKSRKGERLDTFSDRLNQIREFVERSPEDRWKRSIVCGVFFLCHGLALNVHQLSSLIGKCKSSVNGSLHQLGFFTRAPATGIDPQFLAAVPLEYQDEIELRNWTIRTNGESRGMEREVVRVEPIVVPLPLSRPPRAMHEMHRIEEEVMRAIPCPIKWRYKFLDAIHRSMSSV
jgi:hypothetical protein